MKLVNPEALLAQDLETGLGKLGWYYDLIPRHQRLRLPVSGIVSLAIASALREAGYRTVVVQTHPRQRPCADETHIFTVVEPDLLSPTIIDATFGSMLRLAGITPEGVLDGQKNVYPEEKILTFPKGEVGKPAGTLTLASLAALIEGEFDPMKSSFSPPHVAEDVWAINRTYSEFWNPAHFEKFTPTQGVTAAAQYLRGYIRNKSVSLDED